MFFILFMLHSIAFANNILKVQMYSTTDFCRLVVLADNDIGDIQQENLPPFGNSTAKFLIFINKFSSNNPFSSDVNIDGIQHISMKNQRQGIQITIELTQLREGTITSLTPELLIVDLAYNRNFLESDTNIPSKESILEDYISLGLISEQYRKQIPNQNDISSENQSNNQKDLPVKNTPIIVIDPGHGGNQHSGARGSSGLKESDITLEISKRLESKLVEDGYQVILTRNKDEYVSLSQRVKIANSSRADLFISVHINAATVDWMRGFEVYTVATDKSSTHQISNSHHKNMIVHEQDNKDILQGLAYSNPNQDSVQFANLVLDTIVKKP